MYKSAASPSSSTSSSIPKPKFMPVEYNFSALDNDASWDFFFNKHPVDLQRKVGNTKIYIIKYYIFLSCRKTSCALSTF
jgi:hypothetical protein